VHVAADIAPVSGGVPAVVRRLSEKLAACGIPVQIAFATGDPGPLHPGIELCKFPASGAAAAWAWGPGLRSGLAGLAARSDNCRPVFHIHGVWAAPQYFAAGYAHSAGVPFIVTAHGMLEPWLLNEQGFRISIKKRLYWKIFACRALSRANVVHAITPQDREHLSRLFPHNRIEIIPNAVDTDEYIESPGAERSRKILFLGRIEPKKGVDLLLTAFAQARISAEWSVDVAGPVWSDSYMAGLRSLVVKFGIEKRVRFRGPVFGAEKNSLMDQAWFMAVPSHSEVIGLVNLEAAARRLPTITTHETGLHDWESGGGVLIRPEVASLKKAVEDACSWNKRERDDRGAAGRRLVEQRYSWKAVLPLWLQLYDSLASGPAG